MRIHAMSRARACRLQPNATCALISISTPTVVYADSPRREGWKVALHLAFSDVAHCVPFEGDPYTRFDEPMASAATKTASLAKDAGCEDLVIHCDKGLSRSVAIASSLAEAGFGDLQLWECHRPWQANELVVRLMRSTLRPLGAKPSEPELFGGLQ